MVIRVDMYCYKEKVHIRGTLTSKCQVLAFSSENCEVCINILLRFPWKWLPNVALNINTDIRVSTGTKMSPMQQWHLSNSGSGCLLLFAHCPHFSTNYPYKYLSKQNTFKPILTLPSCRVITQITLKNYKQKLNCSLYQCYGLEELNQGSIVSWVWSYHFLSS